MSRSGCSALHGVNPNLKKNPWTIVAKLSILDVCWDPGYFHLIHKLVKAS